MAKCYRCGKWGLFLRVTDGFCAECLPIVLADAQAKKQKIAPQIPVSINRPPVKYDATKLYLDRLSDRTFFPKMVIGDCVAVYSYPQLSVTKVDQGVLKYMCENKLYNVTPAIHSDGNIALIHDGAVVALLNEREEMCRDWIKRGDPIQCQFVSFQSGHERVAMAFYRNEQARLANHKSTVIKLTRYSSADKQDAICCLSDGEKLMCCEDIDSDRICVYSLSHNEIGFLPTKYQDDFEEFAGVFFDHSEKSPDGDKEVPFVKIYF